MTFSYVSHALVVILLDIITVADNNCMIVNQCNNYIGMGAELMLAGPEVLEVILDVLIDESERYKRYSHQCA
jgi:hypothetical protein